LIDFINPKGVKSKGKKLANYEIQNITLIEPPQPEPEEEVIEEATESNSTEDPNTIHNSQFTIHNSTLSPPPPEEDPLSVKDDDGQIILNF